VLEKARISGDLIPIEETWWAEHKDRVPHDPAFQPYSAMIQWLLDEKI
jgi:hypothetical protein